MKNLAFLLLLIITGFSYSQKHQNNFFSENIIVLYADESADSILRNYKVFLNGELHFTKGNYKPYIEMMTLLQRRRKLKTVVMEYSSSEQLFINAFISNEDLREDTLALLKPFVHYDDNFYLPIRTIRHLNIGLPEEEKISVVCIGQESNYKMPVKVLKILIENKSSNEDIERNLAFLRKINPDKIDTVPLTVKQNYFSQLYNHMSTNNLIYNQYLGDDFDYFYRIVEGCVIYDGYNYDPVYYKKREPMFEMQYAFENKREEFMTKHFIKLINNKPQEVFFGQFGRNHSKLLSNEVVDFGLTWNSLASRLNTQDESPVKGQVCTVDILTEKRLKDILFQEGYFLNKAELNSLKQLNGFFQIDKDNSPFKSLKNMFQFIYVRD